MNLQQPPSYETDDIYSRLYNIMTGDDRTDIAMVMIRLINSYNV